MRQDASSPETAPAAIARILTRRNISVALDRVPALKRLAGSVYWFIMGDHPFPRVKRALWRVYWAARGEPPMTPGGLEPSDVARFLGTADPVILEIGCNDGGHTRLFLEAFPTARIHCFEPDARARRRFESQVQSDRVTLYPVAIGACDGTARFYASSGAPPDWADPLPEGWDLSGSIRRPKKHLDECPWCSFDDGAAVPLRGLDSWADEQGVGVVDFIWADVQGAEVDLIRGGARTLERTRYFYTEYANKELYEGQIPLKELLRMLPQFELVCRYSGDVLLRNRLLVGT